jgi:hypothetical protein
MGLFDLFKKKKQTDDNNVEIKSFRDDSKKVYRDEEGLKKDFEGNVREKLYSNEDLDKHMFPTPLERFRGYNFQDTHDENSEWDYFEGFSSLFFIFLIILSTVVLFLPILKPFFLK